MCMCWWLATTQVEPLLLVRSLRYAIERQRATRYSAVLTERQRLDTAVSQMSDGIVVTDENWRLVMANRAACLLLNLPEDGWRGASPPPLSAWRACETSPGATGSLLPVWSETRADKPPVAPERPLLVWRACETWPRPP